MTGGGHNTTLAVAPTGAPRRRGRRSLATAAPQSQSLSPWIEAGCQPRIVIDIAAQRLGGVTGVGLGAAEHARTHARTRGRLRTRVHARALKTQTNGPSTGPTLHSHFTGYTLFGDRVCSKCNSKNGWLF